MLSIYDIAKLAGVSTATVSRVINGARYVAPKTREKVLAVLDQVNYIPNRNASSLTKGRTNTLAIVIPDINNPFFTGIVRGIEDKALEHGLLVLVCNTDEQLSKEERYLSLALEKRVDGVILASTGKNAKHIRPLLAHQVQVVLLDRDLADPPQLDLVRSDHLGGSFQLVNHLIALGHKRIALIEGIAHLSTSKLRRQGYEKALTEAGLPIDLDLIQPGDYMEEGGWAATQKLLALPQPPTAIFAANNFEAIGAMRALHEANLRVPEDISLVCFDDIGLATKVAPFLTVTAQPLYTIGTIAAGLLLERLAGSNEPRRDVVLQAQMIIRASTAPPP